MTDPSLRASDPRVSAWVAANAGAGKTHTLANRVTRLLLAGTRPERILCLTYTKAAASEMQSRLFRRLGKWAMLDDDRLAAKIRDIGAEAEGSDGLRRARRLFAQALETPGGLKIQTIHAFCQNLLSRFPIEAGVPPSFRLLDERTARDLLGDARARVLERAGSGDAVCAAAIAHLVTRTSEGRMNALLDAALGNDRRRLERFLDRYGGDPGALGRKLRCDHGAGEQDTEQSVVTEFVLSIDRNQLAAIVAWLRGGGKTDVARAEQLHESLNAADPAATFDLMQDALFTKGGQRNARLASKSLIQGRPDLFSALESICDSLGAALERLRAVRAASLCEATLVIAQAVRDVYASEKRARGVLDYDDLISQTLTLLERSDASAWVLYKLDGGIDHILIDEAQDTSPEQWAIVRKLREEAFSGAGAEQSQRTIFAVGDEKQSIFSFQGADPAQFDINRRHFKSRIEAAQLAFRDEQLKTSRRSAPAILTFVDEVFAVPEARAGVTSGDDAIAHDSLSENAPGRVEFWESIKPVDGPEPDYWRPVDMPSLTSPVALLATRIADRIATWVHGRMSLPGRAHPVRPGDIMILLPRREPFGSEIIRKLRDRAIPVAGADRIVLTEQIAVMDLVALGRFVLLPEDDLNLAALLRSPLVGLDEDALLALSHGRKGHLWSALASRREECAGFAAAHEFLSAMRSRADYVPPCEFYAHALTARGMRTRLLERLGPEANDAIDEFLSLALTYESANTPSLEGFLHWIQGGGAEIKRDMERARDEVRVMTVHGAKGLEADIVILPDTARLPGNNSDASLLYSGDSVLYPVSKTEAPRPVLDARAAADERTMAEHRRLFYVALTRPRKFLWVTAFETKKGAQPGTWYRLAERAAHARGTVSESEGGSLRSIGSAVLEAAPPGAESAQVKFVPPEWARRPAAAESASPRLIRPSDAAGIEEPAIASPLGMNRFRRGLLVHALLARLPEVDPARRREVALGFLARHEAEDAPAIADETIRVLNDPVFAPVFARGSRAEAGIVAALPELGENARVNGRIDRLAVTDDSVLIVDFKTNRPPPAREEDVPAIYSAQMALYRAGVMRIYPQKRIACALVWTETPSLMPLSDALLDAEMARISARLSRR